jgi:hypothetical protein
MKEKRLKINRTAVIDVMCVVLHIRVLSCADPGALVPNLAD